MEYIRERAELCGVEAKLWLSGKGPVSWTLKTHGFLLYSLLLYNVSTKLILIFERLVIKLCFAKLQHSECCALFSVNPGDIKFLSVTKYLC